MLFAKKRHEQAYSERGFWRKAKTQASAAGRQTVEKALWLLYAVQNPNTPKWARRVIYGALAYFVMPLDAIPDLLPGVGYTDDIGILTAAIAAVALYINEDVKTQARDKLNQWFSAA